MNHLQVALHGDAQEIDLRTINWTPEKVFTEYNHTQPIAKHSGQVNVAKLQYVCYNQEQTAAEIKYVLVEDQQLFLVLIRSYHGVDDERVGCRSQDSDDDDCALEIEIYSTRRR